MDTGYDSKKRYGTKIFEGANLRTVLMRGATSAFVRHTNAVTAPMHIRCGLRWRNSVLLFGFVFLNFPIKHIRMQLKSLLTFY